MLPLRNSYQVVLELSHLSGERFVRVQPEPDWEPVVECARFAGLRSHGIWSTAADLSIEPVWHRNLGEPFVEAFRVRSAMADVEWSEEISTAYFAEYARAAASQFIESGVVKAGERVVYQTMAFARPDDPPQPALPFAVSQISVPIGLRETGLSNLMASSNPCGPGGSDVDVFVSRAVVEEATALTLDAGSSETGGILIGHLHRDPVGGQIFVELVAQIPARHTVGSSVKLTFTADTWTDVRASIALRRREEMMLGWWHSHPAREWCKECPPERQRVCPLGTGFLSSDDRALHRAMFPRAFSVALVMTNTTDSVRAQLFGWRSGVLEPRGFRLLGGDALTAASIATDTPTESDGRTHVCSTRTQPSSPPDATTKNVIDVREMSM